LGTISINPPLIIRFSSLMRETISQIKDDKMDKLALNGMGIDLLQS